MHPECMDFLKANKHLVPAGSDILELGSYNVNGSAREVFELTARYYFGVDIVPGPGVDHVADAAHAHFGRLFDCVISVEVLEHAPEWPLIVRNAKAHLRANGVLLMTAASDPRAAHSAVDGHNMQPHEYTAAPHAKEDGLEFYENISPNRLRTVVESLDFIDYRITHLSRGDVQLVAKT